MSSLTAAVLTVSDGVTHGTRVDASGDEAATMLSAAGFEVPTREVVPDERAEIEAALTRLAKGHAIVVTTGGTGLTARDLTPEATRAVLDKEAPGIGEALRMAVYPRFPRAALSRGIAGVRRRTLVVNLPGSTGGVTDGLDVLDGFVEHAVDLVRGERTGHGPAGS